MKIEQSRIFRKEGGQIGSERSFFHSSASAASVWSRTKHGSRNSHVSRVDLREVQPDLEYAAGACVPSMPESQRQRLLSLWRKAVRCTAGADKHADVYPICGELSITPLLHRWALSFALQVRRCYLNIAPAQLCDKLVRPCHKHSTRGNNSSLYPFPIFLSLGYSIFHKSIADSVECSTICLWIWNINIFTIKIQKVFPRSSSCVS